MIQRRWLKLIADYDIDRQYHPRKIDVVPDVLSKKSKVIFLTQQKELLEAIRQLDTKIILPSIKTQMQPYNFNHVRQED